MIRDLAVNNMSRDVEYLAETTGRLLYALDSIATWCNLASCSGGSARIKIDELCENITSTINPLIRVILNELPESVSGRINHHVTSMTASYRESLQPDAVEFTEDNDSGVIVRYDDGRVENIGPLRTYSTGDYLQDRSIFADVVGDE